MDEIIDKGEYKGIKQINIKDFLIKSDFSRI